jgi:hypothetical protein
MPYTVKLRVTDGAGHFIEDQSNAVLYDGSQPTAGTVVATFEPQSGQTKNCKIGICCFSAKHVALRRKSKNWLARNQDNESKWGDKM